MFNTNRIRAFDVPGQPKYPQPHRAPKVVSTTLGLSATDRECREHVESSTLSVRKWRLVNPTWLRN